MNKVILLGNLTREPEIRYAQGSNMAVAKFSLAINRRYKRDGEPEADFFNCTAFGKTAEFIEKYFKKGSRMALTGRLQNDNYTNKNGEKVYSVNIITEEVEFAEKAGNNNNNDNNTNKDTTTPQTASDDDDFVSIPENAQSEIPFFNM